MKFIPNVSDYTFIDKIAATRKRLYGLAILSLAATYLGANWCTDYIEHHSHSVGFNLLIITGVMVTLLISSFIAAIAAGDLFFPGRWREDVILASPDQKQDEQAFLVNDYRTEFFFLIIGLIVVNTLSLNWATDSFLSEYNDHGFFAVRLRAEAPSERLAALRSLGEPINRDAAEHKQVQHGIVNALDDPTKKVQRKATWLTGELRLTSGSAKLIELVESDQSDVSIKYEALIALGKIGKRHEQSRAFLVDHLTTKPKNRELIGTLRGLGLSKAVDALERLKSFLTHNDKGVVLNSLWAIRQMGQTQLRRQIRKLAEDSPEKIIRCAAYDTLKFTASEKDILWARRSFQTFEKGNECERQTWKDGPDTTRVLVYGDSFREKCLKIVANTNPRAHQDWFQLLANDKSEPFRIRKVASRVLKQLRKQSR